MEQTDILSPRIRWLAIATGVASALALFPVLFLLYPALLIAGGIIQPRFPTTGKWFVWAGAANLGVVVLMYDVMMFPHPWRQTKDPEYMVLPFAATTVLLIWCYGELAADGLRRMRARTSMPPAEPRRVSLGVWIFVVGLNLLLVWGAARWVLAPSWHNHSGDFYFYPFAMSLVQALTIAAFDIYLMRRVVMLRRARRAGQA